MPDADDQPDASPLRIGFAGTPEFAARILQALLDGGFRPVAVYCQPDRPAGRGRPAGLGRRLQAPPVKALAERAGIPVRQPGTLRSATAAEALAGLHLEVLVVAAYGLILPPAILAAPRFGCVNVHASLLPRWRGAAPIERAILAGDTRTGVTIMQMDAGLDTGPVITQRSCPIDPDTDAVALSDRLGELGAEALLECLRQPPPWPSRPQPEDGVCYAGKLTREDARVEWRQPADHIRRQLLALAHRMPPVAQIGGARVRLLAAQAGLQPADSEPGTILEAGPTGIRVACGHGTLLIERLQLNVGKGRPLAAADAVNGYPALFRAGERFEDGP
jgi:methionyl-tRNA formyltransferase